MQTIHRLGLLWLLALAVAGCAPKPIVKPEPTAPPAPPKIAYLIVQAAITDRAKFGGYIAALPPVYAKFGGQYLAVAPAATVERLHGARPTESIVISYWPSLERLREFWGSPEYAQVKALREGTGQFVVLAAEGEPPTDSASGASALLLIQQTQSTAIRLDAALPAIVSATSENVVVLEGQASPRALTLVRAADKAALRAGWQISTPDPTLQVDLIDALPRPAPAP
jgi:uncharacterized protein (DUF1330 family)